ncbi:hypothetical protein [Stygiolobus azoricus]|uniref:ArnR1-like winged helix-turn-helix domain-containing protein n=1 Tax=Stygiolobus azoricus TaxID=41675 RepID=A0A650CPN4_9CREN|nr:hypothetical protein [Stygiolobus azoricus]QGR19801.1 hypothetical protein D1868_07290 [Stygiolobus azoricus]
MYGILMRMGGYQILESLKNGPVKISQLRNSVPLYGSAFDFVLSQLMVTGLVRKFEKDGEEYVEITELGRNFPYQWAYGSYQGFGPYYGCGPHHHGHHGNWW